VLDFYTDERVKLLYKHNLCAVANRRSSVNGVKYRDDPAILSWDLINEPR
jgi:mannan endo-1,4-beta-mannosidase